MASKIQRQPQRTEQQNKVVTATAQQWSGPLPPPDALEQFNAIIPNGAERIIGMVEREQAHRIAQEQAVVAATVRDTRRGHWMGLVIAIASIVAAVVAAMIGAPAAVSIALVGVPIVAIVRSIIESKSNQQ